MSENRQTVVHQGTTGRVVAVDSAYDTLTENRGRDVVVNASYAGVLPARFVGQHAPRGAIGVDCAIGPDGAGIAGLWFLEALGVPAAAAAVDSVRLGDGVDMFHTAVVSRRNAPAAAMGVQEGISVKEASLLLLESDAAVQAPSDVTNRTVVHESDDGRQIVCTDSIAFGLPEDGGRNVLCTAGHTGRSSLPYLRSVAPHGFICSDGGRGKDDAGVAGLGPAAELGLAGASVDARSARMGDGLSTYHDGIISACNNLAAARGVEVGQTAREAARLLLDGGQA